MGNAKQVAILAAGYLLGRTKTIKSAMLLAGGIAYGRMTAQNENGSIVSKFSDSPEIQKISSGLAEAARGAVAATASKGVESLNQNLQKRSAALRGDDDTSTEESSEQAEDEHASEESETPQQDQDAEETEAESSNASESGGR